ncbi:MAG: DUF3108 domain-containing protein [Candidatus Kapabacteria bacterium]|nr:DUF3108 domain-containing protein [Candidatus Kapabacteria bacterium]
MKTLTAAVTMLCAAAAFVVFGGSSQQQQPAEKEANRYVPNEAFGFGEKLDYRVGYKFITAGNASFEVMPKPATVNGRQCYDIRFEVRSLESLEWLYKVRDRYRTVMDVNGIFPWEFEQSIREGGYSRDVKASFDQVNHVAKTTEGEYKITPYIHDIVSAFYYIRTQDLRQYSNNSIIPLRNFFDRESHDLGVKILGKQTVEVAAGKFKCIVIEPLIKDGGLFKSDGRILIWLSDDDRKIPVKVSSKIPIGTIDAELTGYRGLRGDLRSKVE